MMRLVLVLVACLAAAVWTYRRALAAEAHDAAMQQAEGGR